MTGNREVEVSHLARRVEEIQKLIRDGGHSGHGYSLAAFLEDAKAKLDTAHADFHADTENRERKEREFTASVAELVERESRLNAAEKEQYGRFLEMDYFRKKDLDELAAFYKDGGGYDKLSEEGKQEMTKRLAEGIRRGEIDYDQMPDVIKSKAAERLSDQGIEIPGGDSISANAAGKTSQHVVKSASGEADSSKKTNSGEKNASEVEKVREESTDQHLAFVDSPTPVNPTEIRCPPGDGRAI